MLNKKGFTLVELLAVIVILAIIAVIAVPSVLKIISGARQDAVKANVRSAVKAAELAVAKGETSGELSSLDIDNNPFKGGSWYYDIESRKVIIYEARDNDTIADSKYVITGDKDEINSGNLIVSNPNDANQNLLASKITTTSLGGTTKGSIIESGYIKGTDPNNYICFDSNKNKICDINELKWRAVKVNEDKSILMQSIEVIDNVLYDNITCLYDEDTYMYSGGCTSNFAKASSKSYLNTDFLNKITNINLIKYNNWTVQCTTNGIDYKQCKPGEPSSIISKIGLLTLKDYMAVAEVPFYTASDNYLNNGTIWWSSTGFGVDYDITWSVGSNGSINSMNVGDADANLRPAAVLNSGITITGGNGTQGTPYTVE